jgi:lysozyme family protein
MTVEAAKKFSKQELIDGFSEEKESFYRSLNTFDTFGKGWLNRVAAVKIKATSMIG